MHACSLGRRLGPVDAAVLVIANVIGVGIFATPGLVATIVPNAFAIAGVVVADHAHVMVDLAVPVLLPRRVGRRVRFLQKSIIEDELVGAFGRASPGLAGFDRRARSRRGIAGERTGQALTRPPETLVNTMIYGTPACTSLLWEVVDRGCVGGISCASARAAGVNFQARSFSHSDISPFRINELRPEQCSAKPSFTHIRFVIFRSANPLTRPGRGCRTQIVSDLVM